MSAIHPIADEAEEEIGALKRVGKENGWTQHNIHALFTMFDRWLQHPRLLDPKDDSPLRITVLNELTFLISDPIIGDYVWEYIRGIAKVLGQDGKDCHHLRESWQIATFEVIAEPPEVPDYLKKLFSLAGDKDTRWAVFGAYENVPWRFRPHAHKYSAGQITDEDCDRWLVDQGWGEDEFLMQKIQGEQAAPSNP